MRAVLIYLILLGSFNLYGDEREVLITGSRHGKVYINGDKAGWTPLRVPLESGKCYDIKLKFLYDSDQLEGDDRRYCVKARGLNKLFFKVKQRKRDYYIDLSFWLPFTSFGGNVADNYMMMPLINLEFTTPILLFVAGRGIWEINEPFENEKEHRFLFEISGGKHFEPKSSFLITTDLFGRFKPMDHSLDNWGGRLMLTYQYKYRRRFDEDGLVIFGSAGAGYTRRGIEFYLSLNYNFSFPLK